MHLWLWLWGLSSKNNTQAWFICEENWSIYWHASNCVHTHWQIPWLRVHSVLSLNRWDSLSEIVFSTPGRKVAESQISFAKLSHMFQLWASHMIDMLFCRGPPATRFELLLCSKYCPHSPIPGVRPQLDSYLWATLIIWFGLFSMHYPPGKVRFVSYWGSSTF